MTKTFTAAAILQLQSTGALAIDKSVLTYLPSYPFDARVTVRMMLNMVSGLANYTSFPDYNTWATSGATEQTILTAIADAPLQFTPGSEYQYSNSNYFVLGVIIEVVSSESYPEYLAMKIIAPLALTNTSLVRQPPAAALSYDPTDKLVPIPMPSVHFGNGALWSDVLDLASWDAALFGGRVLPAAQFAEMVTPPSTPPSGFYGMGLFYTPMLNRRFAWHSGLISPSNAFNGFFLDDGFSVSLLANATPINGGSDQFLSFAEGVIQAICTSSSSSSRTPC